MRAWILAVAVMAVPAQSSDWQKPYVSLTTPAALEALERDRPEHFRVAQEMIKAAQVGSCDMGPQMLPAEVDRLKCSTFMVLTSYPPKRQVMFSIDGITYTAYAAMQQLTPAQRHPAAK